MWMLVLFSLVIAHETWAKYDCSKNEDDCVNPELFNYIPMEISEFNRLCPQLPAVFRCLKDFQDKCLTEETRIFRSEEEFETMFQLFGEFCEEGTLFNTVATENLKCLNETFSKTTCPEQMRAVTGANRIPMEETEDEDDYRLPIVDMCVQDILESNCIASDIGRNCGSVAQEAAQEFIRRSQYIEDTCGRKVAKDILENLDQYKLDLQHKAIVIAALEQIILSGEN